MKKIGLWQERKWLKHYATEIASNPGPTKSSLDLQWSQLYLCRLQVQTSGQVCSSIYCAWECLPVYLLSTKLAVLTLMTSTYFLE